jgi:hypothetical protein
MWIPKPPPIVTPYSSFGGHPPSITAVAWLSSAGLCTVASLLPTL